MSAGIPNYQRLQQIGKLPKDLRNTIPGLEALDKKTEELEKVLKILCDGCKAKINPAKKEEEKTVKINCPAHQCNYTAEAKTESLTRNNLRLHMEGKHPETTTPQANIK